VLDASDDLAETSMDAFPQENSSHVKMCLGSRIMYALLAEPTSQTNLAYHLMEFVTKDAKNTLCNFKLQTQIT
jgi:hypothetical protein